MTTVVQGQTRMHSQKAGETDQFPTGKRIKRERKSTTADYQKEGGLQQEEKRSYRSEEALLPSSMTCH